MVDNQRVRFQQKNIGGLIQNYINDPVNYEKEYLRVAGEEGLAQYRDYFESERDDLDEMVLPQYKNQFAINFENWQLAKQDRSSFQTLPLPEWNNELGWWANAVALLKQVSSVPEKVQQIDQKHTGDLLSSSSVVDKKE